MHITSKNIPLSDNKSLFIKEFSGLQKLRELIIIPCSLTKNQISASIFVALITSLINERVLMPV